MPWSGSCTTRSSSAGGSGAAPSGSAPAGSAFGTFVLGRARCCSLFFGAGPLSGVSTRTPASRSTRRGCSSAAAWSRGCSIRVLGKRMAARTAHGVGRPRAVARLRAVHRDRRGQPDPVGGGAGRLQPLPALRHRLRPRRPLGPGLRGGRRGGRRGRPRPSRAPPGTSATGRTGGFSDVASSMDSFSTVAAGTFVSTPGLLGLERLQRRRRLLRRWRRRLVGRQLVAARDRRSGPARHDEGPPPRCGCGPSWVRWVSS